MFFSDLAGIAWTQDPVSASCGHSFCRACIGEYSSGAVGVAKCPTCSAPLTINFSTPAAVRTLDPSTRRRACVTVQEVLNWSFDMVLTVSSISNLGRKVVTVLLCRQD